jgi:hypothetical protein
MPFSPIKSLKSYLGSRRKAFAEMQKVEFYPKSVMIGAFIPLVVYLQSCFITFRNTNDTRIPGYIWPPAGDFFALCIMIIPGGIVGLLGAILKKSSLASMMGAFFFSIIACECVWYEGIQSGELSKAVSLILCFDCWILNRMCRSDYCSI